jgi:hypothetical protein
MTKKIRLLCSVLQYIISIYEYIRSRNQDKKINDSREFFEQLVSEYSTCGRFWKIYIEQEVHNFI